MRINENYTIANIVREDYRTAEVFSKNGMDFCCGGKTPLAEACQKHDIDIKTLMAQLIEAVDKEQPTLAYASLSNTKLINHIVSVHHQYIEDSVPYLSQLLRKIADVHGENHPELIEVRDIFDEATDALYDHMKKEELILFPAIEAIEKAKAERRSLPTLAFGSITNPIQAMEGEHDFEGDAFKKIAALTNDFTPPKDACNTYLVAFSKLKEFVEDLHRHIHLENNILFENAKALELELAV